LLTYIAAIASHTSFMTNSEPESTPCAIYVDMGTTNTRGWLMRGSQVVASAREATGVRTAARSGSNGIIRETLREIVSRLRNDAVGLEHPSSPTCIVGAGMITSSLGLLELPHIRPPAGLEDLQTAAKWHSCPEISDFPILLVPGVRCGPELASVTSIHELDVMRGEETLCAGLVASRTVNRLDVVMNLGSHWKAIRLNEQGKIIGSLTSLSGELIHAAQQNTILAGSVAQDWPTNFCEKWIHLGMTEQRRSGLSRTAFCTRLLDLEQQGTPADRLAFLVGAFIASDLDALLAGKVFHSRSRVGIVGSQAVAEAWQSALQTSEIQSVVITQKQTEDAFLTALRLILAYRLTFSADGTHSGRTYSS
jgi:2-dehydro-3-deoxygalactonokinase